MLVIVGEIGQCLVIVGPLGDESSSSEEISLVLEAVLGAEFVRHAVEF